MVRDKISNDRISILYIFFFYKEIFRNLCNPLVRPHLKYGNIISPPPISEDSQSQSKEYREEPTRFSSDLKDFGYIGRLKELDLPTLKYRKFKSDSIQEYKIIIQIGDLKFDFI